MKKIIYINKLVIRINYKKYNIILINFKEFLDKFSQNCKER